MEFPHTNETSSSSNYNTVQLWQLLPSSTCPPTFKRLPSFLWLPILMAHKPGRCQLHFAPFLASLLHPVPRPPRPHPSMLSVGWALSLNSPLQWQAVSPSEKTPDLKRALRTLLSKMKVMSTAATTAPNTQLKAPCHPVRTHMQKTHKHEVHLEHKYTVTCW